MGVCREGTMRNTDVITIDDFDELYTTFGPMVLRRCRYLLQDEEAALDAMQDVFVRVIERHGKLKGVCASLFYTVATSVCLNKIRSDKVRRGPRIDHILHEIADNKTARHEEQTDTSLFLDLLFDGAQEDTKYMATLHYVDGFTLEETAREVGMSVSGVRKRLSTLRKKALKCAGE